jgi:hypothetical protein
MKAWPCPYDPGFLAPADFVAPSSRPSGGPRRRPAVAANAAAGRSLVASAPGSRHGRQPSPPSIESKPRMGRHREGDIGAVFVATGIAAKAPVALFGLGKLEKSREGGLSTKTFWVAPRDRDLGLTPPGYVLLPLRGSGHPRAAKRDKSRMIQQPSQGRLFITPGRASVPAGPGQSFASAGRDDRPTSRGACPMAPFAGAPSHWL